MATTVNISLEEVREALNTLTTADSTYNDAVTAFTSAKESALETWKQAGSDGAQLACDNLLAFGTGLHNDFVTIINTLTTVANDYEEKLNSEAQQKLNDAATSTETETKSTVGAWSGAGA